MKVDETITTTKYTFGNDTGTYIFEKLTDTSLDFSIEYSGVTTQPYIFYKQ